MSKDEKITKINETLNSIDLGDIDNISEEQLLKLTEEIKDYEGSISRRRQLQILNEIDELEEKVENDTENAKKNKKQRKREYNEDLPIEIKPLMDRANAAFYDGRYDEALDVAYEAKDLCPNASEPYILISLISSYTDNLDHALDFAVQGAEKAAKPYMLWNECYRLACLNEDYLSAARYLKKAAESETNNIRIVLELKDLVEKHSIKERNLINYIYTQLIERDPLNSEYVIEYANYLHENARAIEALDVLRVNVEQSIKSNVKPNIQVANLLSSCYLNEYMNDDVIRLDSVITNAPPDFRLNAGIAYIRKKEFEKSVETLKCMRDVDVLTYKSQVELIADSYYEEEYYLEAAKWYYLMIEAGIEKEFDYAVSLENGGEIDLAIQTLKDFVKENHESMNEIHLLYNMMKKRYSEHEATEWLNNNIPNSIKSDRIVLDLTNTALLNKDYRSFLDTGILLICKIFIDLRYTLKADQDMIRKILGFRNPRKMPDFLKSALRYVRTEEDIPFSSPIDLFLISKQMIKVAFDLGEFEMCFVLSGLTLICKEMLYKSPEYREIIYPIIFSFALSAFNFNRQEEACSILRSLLLDKNFNFEEEKGDNHFFLSWEYFNLFIQKTPTQEMRSHKFLLRTLDKFNDNEDRIPLHVLLGNHSLCTCWIDQAITQYVNVLRSNPDEPLLTLLLAVAYTSKAFVRTYNTTRKSILSAYACIRKYFELREMQFPAEAYYNFGKFYQTIKMIPQAERYFKKVLELDVDYSNIAIDTKKHERIYSLKRDAAHDLFLLYKDTRPGEARRILRKYLTF